MSIMEMNLHWITGVMFGIEFVTSGDFEDEAKVKWGFCLDLFIVRILILFRKI